MILQCYKDKAETMQDLHSGKVCTWHLPWDYDLLSNELEKEALYLLHCIYNSWDQLWPTCFHKSQHYWTSPRHAYLQKGTHNTRGGPTCMHESLQVQCIDQDVIMWPQWHQCTVLVVIHARMSDLLWHNTQGRWNLHVVLWLLHSL